MSFAHEIKQELSRSAPQKKCCAIAELAGMILSAGNLQISASGMCVEISTENEDIAQRVCALVLLVYGDVVSIERHERHRLNRDYTYRVVVTDPVVSRELIQESGMMRSNGAIRSALIRKSCCRNALLRGLFLGCGTMVNPEKAYQLEMVFTNENRAEAVLNLLKGCGVNGKKVKRNQYCVVYTKEGEYISIFLVLIGAHGALLKFEDVRAMKELRNSINRRTNCDNANTDKAVNAAIRQRRAIDKLLEKGLFESLSPDLQEAAQARMDYPDMTLQELAEELNLSKSGINHRLRKLTEMGEALMDGEEEEE